jgi:outer membrane protein OmpA-like peptidoglycan-associated protein
LSRIIIVLGVLASATAARAAWEDHSPPTARPAFCASFKPKVFFNMNRSSLSDQAAKDIVSLVAKAIAACRPTKVVIAGFTDRAEVPSVAFARADTVKRELMIRGVASALIEVTAPGAIDFAKPPPSVQNRRAEMAMYYR